MSNVVMLTRIRLARNLKNYPFPCRLNTAGKNEVCEKIIDAVKNCNSPLADDLEVFYIKDLGTYANWQATKATGDYDARTFQIKARPEKKIENLRPGMSVILEKEN